MRPERATLDGMGRKGTRKNPHAAALGRLGGLKGGYARADALSAEERRVIARKAAHARWRKRKR
jgi:hypothetical protein